jgi:exopolysaccharide biosynthesis polyprenyl glycosylphosphotransferase
VLDQVILVATLVLLVTLFEERGSFRYLLLFVDGLHYAWEMIGVGVLLVTWITIFNSLVHYDANRFTTLRSALMALVKATSLASFVLFLGGQLFSFSRVSNLIVVLFWIITTLLGIAVRLVSRATLTVLRRSGLNARQLVIVGTSARAMDLARRIESRPELGYRIAGFISAEPVAKDADWAAAARWPIVTDVRHIKPYLEKGSVDEVMVCLPVKESFARIHEIFELCRDIGLVVRLIPDAADAKALTRLQIEQFEGDYVVTFFRERLLWQLLLKRVLDLAVSTTLLLLLAPLFLIVAILIKATSPGPVFFVQERVGMNKRRFKLLKFRSMVADAEHRRHELEALNEMDGPVFKIKNDPRITPIGRFIRQTSIDELPQLINVFLGHMSLVGPRPPLASEVEQYAWFDRKRLCIKPGITCLWQVSGRNDIPFSKWMELDREYIDNWSIWMDLRILFKTIPVVLFGKGAS